MIARRLLLAAPAAALLPAALARPALATASAAPSVGAAAPGFTGTDSNGKAVSLAQFAGKPVVLEWTNDGCPYVRKWYDAGAMQELQRQAAAMGAVWLTVISSPPGEQGFADGPRANELTALRNAAPTHVLLDPEQKIARAYAATVTPHMFIVDAKGVLVYAGGADSIPSSRSEDLPKATPYVKNALAAIAAGRPVPNPITRPYGCVVKYRNQA
jgi:peroxiredoxin